MIGRSVLAIAAVAVVASLAGATCAWSYWTAGSSAVGAGRADIAALGAGATPSGSLAGRTATVSWAQTTVSGAPLGSLASGGYTVRRYAASAPGTPITPAASCNGSITGAADPLSCSESSLPTGRWRYTVTPTYFLWAGSEGAQSTALTVAPDAPTSVTLTNGGGAGNVYVNAANASSLSFDVDLPTTSLAGDTVHLTVSDGSSTVSVTGAGITAGGTRTFSGVNVSALADGPLTISSWATSIDGDSSATTAISRTKDTVAPTMSTMTTGDVGGTAGKLDRVTVAFSETLAVYAAGTAPWTLANVPSGGTLSSVSVSGAVATLTVVEGPGPIDTTVGSFTIALAANATGIRDAAANLSTFTPTTPSDGSAPVRTAMQMRDVNGNGKIDQATVTFSETLASSTDTAPWTLTNTPSGGTLASLSTSAATATLTINEGAGAASTAVGSFTITLAASATGIRDSSGNQASFAAAAPTDAAKPALLTLTMQDTNTNGKVDRALAVFSETLAAYSAGTTPWTLANTPSGGTLTTVTVATTTATLTISEGAGAQDTSTGSFTIALATNATGIRDAAANLSTFTPTTPSDGSAPVRTAMQMRDVNGNGKIDQATVTFSETLASSTDTAPWTLTNTPSGGTLASLSTSAATATLTITEGAGAASTAVGSFTITLAASATGIRDSSGNQASFAAAAPTDAAKPALLTLTMQDTNTNGKVDRALAVFSETLAAYSAGTTPWTLANTPSGGTLTTVTVATTTATLTISEGAGAQDTSTGSFTIALAANATGIRDAAANLSTFTPTTPSDAAKPVPVSVTSVNNGTTAGRMEAADTITVTFSEAILASSVPGTTTVTETDPAGGGNDTLTITGLTNGAVSLGANTYVTTNNSSGAFASSTLALAGAAVTVTVGGSCTGTCALAAGQGALVFTPAATITDAAANAAAGSVTTLATFRAF